MCGHEKRACCRRPDLCRRNLSGMTTAEDEILIKLGTLMPKFLPVYLLGSPYIELAGQFLLGRKRDRRIFQVIWLLIPLR